MSDFMLENELRRVYEDIRDAVLAEHDDIEIDAEKVMRVLVEGQKPARTLKAHLRQTAKTYLQFTVDDLSLDVSPDAPRKDIEDAVYEAFIEKELAKYLYRLFNEDSVALIHDIEKAGDYVVPKDLDNLDILPGLMRHFIISAWIDKDDNLVLCLTKEAGKQLTEFRDECIKQYSTLMEIGEATVAATELYGVIPIDDFLELCEEYGLANFPHDEMRKEIEYMAEVDYKDVFIADGEYIIHSWLGEEDEKSQLEYSIDRLGIVPRKVLDRDEFLKFADPGYTDLSLPWARLRKYIERDCLIPGQTAIDFESLFIELRGIIKIQFPMQAYFELLNEYGIEPKDIKQANEIAGILQEIHNNTRIWGNNGHTPLELAAHSEIDRIRDEFSEYRDKDRREKTGRNDPCPCGSGKKYKNCCGRVLN